jgi:phage N-6-adenine-methyltransferase
MSFVSRNHPQQVAARGALDEVDDRGTDREFFASLEERFGKFTLDVAAAKHNAKCAEYITREQDGLSQVWTGRVWCNPPYSNIRAWVEKAWREFDMTTEYGTALGPEFIAMLLPANRVEQAWWQDLVEPYRDRPGSPLRVEFLRGRMRFDRPGWEKPAKGDRPPFGCCLLIWGDPATHQNEAS